MSQLVVISDPVLLQEVSALEREGAIEKPDSLISWDETKVPASLWCILPKL